MKHIETLFIGKRHKTYRIEWVDSPVHTDYKVYAGCICVGGAKTKKDARKLAQIDYDLFYADKESKES